MSLYQQEAVKRLDDTLTGYVPYPSIAESKADYRESDYRYSRVSRDPSPLVKSAPVKSLGTEILQAAFYVAVGVLICMAAFAI